LELNTADEDEPKPRQEAWLQYPKIFRKGRGLGEKKGKKRRIRSGSALPRSAQGEAKDSKRARGKKRTVRLDSLSHEGKRKKRKNANAHRGGGGVN